MQVSRSVRLLPPGGFLATLVGFDPKSQDAEFKIGCGWNTRTGRKVSPGLWRLNLRGVTFAIEVGALNPDGTVNLATGHNVAVTRKAWEQDVLRAGFSGLIYTNGKPSWITDGPGSLVCQGHF